MLQQNQMLVQTMLHRMDAEDRRRAEEEKRRKDEETAAKKAAEAVTTVLLDPFAGPETGSSSSGAVPTYTGTVVFSGNRAEKYLPPRPPLQHGAMGKSRMKEVEEWHRFVEVYSSWLALIDEAYVNEFRLALRHPHEIVQAKLAKDVAARSAKLFYYLGQSLAKWERGLELLRSVSKRQDMSAAGYEVVRTIHMNYSIVSRMEAVHVRDQALALHKHCNHLRKPLEIIRHLEDELAKAESKLGNFPDLRLSPADKCTLLLQAISSEARQYVVLRGKTSTWDDLTASLKFFEEQLRLCEVPGHTRAASEVLCDYCGKKGHKKENCWQKKKDEKGSPSKGGKGEKGKGKKGEKGKGGDTPRGGKGDKGKGEQPKGKGKKKKKKGQRVRSAGETSESEAESSAPGTPKKATAMALRVRFDPCENGELSGVGRVLRDSEPEPAVTSSVFVSQDTNFLGTIGSLCSSEDVKRVCAIHEVEARDVWLVDSGATCHIIATDFLGGFRVVKRRERPVTLYNASGGEIKVHGIVDIEFHFGNLCLVLEEVLVADVGFNAISPWAAAEKGIPFSVGDCAAEKYGNDPGKPVEVKRKGFRRPFMKALLMNRLTLLEDYPPLCTLLKEYGFQHTLRTAYPDLLEEPLERVYLELIADNGMSGSFWAVISYLESSRQVRDVQAYVGGHSLNIEVVPGPPSVTENVLRGGHFVPRPVLVDKPMDECALFLLNSSNGEALWDRGYRMVDFISAYQQSSNIETLSAAVIGVYGGANHASQNCKVFWFFEGSYPTSYQAYAWKRMSSSRPTAKTEYSECSGSSGGHARYFGDANYVGKGDGNFKGDCFHSLAGICKDQHAASCGYPGYSEVYIGTIDSGRSWPSESSKCARGSFIKGSAVYSEYDGCGTAAAGTPMDITPATPAEALPSDPISEGGTAAAGTSGEMRDFTHDLAGCGLCVSRAIIDVVPGYRPQAKGRIERQVAVTKQSFWAMWLDLEKQVGQKVPLGGLLWQTALLYCCRVNNLWCSSPEDGTTPLDRVHEAIVNRPMLKGSGVLERDDYVYEGDNISAIAEFNPLAVDVSDPEAPILFEPLEPDPSEAPAVEDEGEAEPELVADEEMPMADAAELPPDLDEYEPSEGNVGDVETEGELDAAIRHMTEQGLNSLCAGPDLRVRGANTEVASSFEMPFGKSRVRCVVPKRAVSETSGEVLEPSLLQQSMELELKELESFKVGEVVSEREARSEAKKCGRRVLSCRWVNTVKRPGFSQILDPTIFRRKGKKGLLIVLFYVDDLLIWAEDSSDARRVFEDLQKRYKLKKTGELFEKQPGEVSFLGRRIFRRRKGDNRVYFGLDSKYLESCCEEYNISKSSAKLPPLERRYAELLKKVGNEAELCALTEIAKEGVTNPADALTKSPTPENLVSLYEACGLVEEPQEWSKYLEESDEPSVAFPKKVTFKEPNTNDTLCYEVEGYEDFEIPSSWREAGVKLVAGKAKFVVFELCCEAESALALACEGKRDVMSVATTMNT
ncbi:unnamed protein product [Symbiodinium pilosum]|uniref:CCHC-type domain-containing protein n=1 Tax=Symbiodinium pilosum TaxID=2952 RepID=A0A812WXI4_SYMPI|nr:unnamed protein product [Symbiodinium pilosum]